MSERRSAGLAASIAAGLLIGAVETILAVAFAAFVFGGLLASYLADGVGLYLAAAAVTLGDPRVARRAPRRRRERAGRDGGRPHGRRHERRPWPRSVAPTGRSSP